MNEDGKRCPNIYSLKANAHDEPGGLFTGCVICVIDVPLSNFIDQDSRLQVKYCSTIKKNVHVQVFAPSNRALISLNYKLPKIDR